MCLFLYLWSVAAFMLHWQSSVVATDTIWLTKPKLLTIWLFMEKVCGDLL